MKPQRKLTATARAASLLLAVCTIFASNLAAADGPDGRPRPAAPASPNVPAAPVPPAVPFPAAEPGAPPPPPSVGTDPATGLPVESWMDPNWPDPDRRLKEVTFDSLPAEQIGEFLRREFTNAFDILIPIQWQTGTIASAEISPNTVPIRLQLRNVSASEIFNAMNLMFEGENSPYRWALRMNGNRPMAILRVLPQMLPPNVSSPPAPVTRMVYFVGDLIDGNPSPKAMEDLVRTVSDIFQKAHGSPQSVIQFHKEAQLLIVTGTGDQLSFVQSTLSALREKARYKQLTVTKPNPPTNKNEESKPQERP